MPFGYRLANLTTFTIGGCGVVSWIRSSCAGAARIRHRSPQRIDEGHAEHISRLAARTASNTTLLGLPGTPQWVLRLDPQPGRRLVIVLVASSLTACWLSHEASAGTAGSTDAAVRRPDASAMDGSHRPDASSLVCSVVNVLDRRVAEWPSISGCGPEIVTRVVARSGGFDILAREAGWSCGRRPLSAVQRATTTGDRLTLGDDRVVLGADGDGLAATASGNTLLVTSGLRWATLRGAYDEIASGRLAETPMSAPGCSSVAAHQETEKSGPAYVVREGCRRFLGFVTFASRTR